MQIKITFITVGYAEFILSVYLVLGMVDSLKAG